MSAAQLDETDQVQIIEREAATHPPMWDYILASYFKYLR